MAAESNRRRLRARACSTSIVDRISDLPDPIADHILSFLDINDLTRFGCVSRNCRNLYLSAPSLNFDGFADANMSIDDKRLKLSSLDRYLFLHRGVKRMQCFRIAYRDYSAGRAQRYTDEVSFRMMTWIEYALRCNVEVLAVDVCIDTSTRPSLPSCIFLSGSLKSLSFSMECKIVKAPPLDSSSNLEYLRLDNVHIEDASFYKWISCSCKCIKELHLLNVYGLKNVNIESSTLKKFSFSPDYIWIGGIHLSIAGEKLEDISIDWESYSTHKSMLNIVAPNLKYLKWSGKFLTHQNLGRRMCLKKAELSLNPDENVDFNILFEVLRSMCRIEALILNKKATTALFKGAFVPEVLGNVCYLSIHIGSWLDALVPEMVSIFGRIPNLTTLQIKADPICFHLATDCSGSDMGYWRLQNLSFIRELKNVTIELSDGSNGIQFAKYILEFAQNLKNMMIVHSPQQTRAITELKDSKMASNAVTLDFENDQQRGRRSYERGRFR